MRRKLETHRVQLAVATRAGVFLARYSVTGLAGLAFPARRTTGGGGAPKDLPLTLRRWHRATGVALKRALAGRAPRLLPPLDLAAGTAFQQLVWQALLKIPCGQTRSYGELAQTLNNPRAARAVGRACGANPIPVLVPCHRVLAANRKLGGFSGGREWKKKLLWREGSRDLWQT